MTSDQVRVELESNLNDSTISTKQFNSTSGSLHPPLNEKQKKKLKILSHQYAIFRGQLLGSGHAGKVYRGLNRITNEEIAIKELSKKYLLRVFSYSMCTKQQRTYNDHLLMEYRLGNRLHYVKQICRPLDYVESVKSIYLILPLASGDLLQFLRKRGYMWKEEDYKRMLYPIFQSVQEIHEAGYAHRDIKLENLLVFHRDGKYELELTDLEMAARTKGSRAHESVGTMEYCAPEVVYRTLAEGVDYKKADAWSLGVVLYVCLTGAFPYDMRKPINKRYLQYSPNTIYDRFLSDEVKQLLQGLLKEDANQRWSIKQALVHRFWGNNDEAAVPEEIPTLSSDTTNGTFMQTFTLTSPEFSEDVSLPPSPSARTASAPFPTAPTASTPTASVASSPATTL